MIVEKAWHISDIHGLWNYLEVPKDITYLFVTGDSTNGYTDRPIAPTIKQSHEFLEWLDSLYIPNIVVIAGNHDVAIEKRHIRKEHFEAVGAHYLEMDSININGYKIWGAPYVPTWKGNAWSFQKQRGKMFEIWAKMPQDVDILLTHVPPKGILDFGTISRESAGCMSLLRKVIQVEPVLHCFGHQHDGRNPEIYNSGTRTISGKRTIFSNGSCLINNRKSNYHLNQGNIITLSRN